MSAPALVINGQVKFSGKVASVTEIMGMQPMPSFPVPRRRR